MANNVNGLNNEEIMALDKAVAAKVKKQAREEMTPGVYEINKMIRLSGTIKVGEDYKQNKTASMPQTKMLMAALKLNGKSIKAFMREYLDGEYEVAKEDEAELKMMWEEMASKFEDTFAGKVTAELEITGVEDVETDSDVS